ncbi:MAG: hypothetical protein OCD03_04415 [Hyphomicrobiales bacterium]
MLNTRFYRASFIVVFALLLQAILPLLVSANTRNVSEFTSSQNIIVICSGNELVYLMLDENGNFSEIEEPDYIPNHLQIGHCDTCVFSTAIPIFNEKTPYYLSVIDAHKRPNLQNLPSLNLHKRLPPTRAPPA